MPLKFIRSIPYEPPLIETPEIEVIQWEPWDGPLGDLPRTRKDIYDVFGNPGVGKLDKRWARQNMIVARDLPLVPKGKIYCHKLAEPYIREALRRCALSCPDYQIARFGCFNFRHQRHDPSRPLSTHSWGIAVDTNPGQNRGIYFKKNDVPEAFSDLWWDWWPIGMPEAFVRAWQSVGFAWGADWDEDGTSTDHTFVDPMHFELRDRS